MANGAKMQCVRSAESEGKMHGNHKEFSPHPKPSILDTNLESRFDIFPWAGVGEMDSALSAEFQGKARKSQGNDGFT